MTGYRRGDVVLVAFVFSDESGAKLRPALIVSSDAYQQAREEVIVAAITSNVTRRLLGDYDITSWADAGLLFPSLVTGIVRTIKHVVLRRKLGTLTQPDEEAYRRLLRRCLDL